MNIGISVGHHARRFPGQVAVDENGERTLTYAELDVRTNRLAHYLAEVIGVAPGDRVGYLLYNRLEIVELLVACAKLGAIAAPMNFRLSETDLRANFGNAGVRLVVTQHDFLDVVRMLAGELGFAVLTVEDEYPRAVGSGSMAAPASVLSVGGARDALIQYTSGTTGRPKGATFTHDAVLAHAANVGLEYAIDGSSRVLVSIPHNSATNIQTIPALYHGATLVLGDVRSFDGAAWLERVNRLRVTHTQVVPTMLYRVLEVARSSGESMPTMRRLGYGSAPMSVERAAELMAIFGNVFIQLYGMIETAAVGTMLRPTEHERALAGETELLGSVGQPSYGIDVRVVDESGEYLAENGRGEVVFKGPYVMRGYWDAPELTEQTVRNGWLHSGDIAELRDGWFYLVDRSKDIIIRGGQNIASKEVEEALYHHPAVMEAAVIGVADPEWGENILAAVVLRPGARATADAIRKAAQDSGLTRFKTPAHIEFVPELPRNAIGKIQKGVLRERYAGKAAVHTG
ncbi:class I adenylate-forming enzyme family protein [Actinophytocola sp.]|uniref:class I adenylate-forming enzyme family protein n=1 Tax=Actinophytocola sp. TaxID=1872138 RepID=UPI003D6BD9F1